MSRVLDRGTTLAGSEHSRLSFDRRGFMSRHLKLDDKTAFKLTEGCNTCPFYFERSDGANSAVQIDRLAAILNKGVTRLDDELTRDLSEALPRSSYDVLLLESLTNRIEPYSTEDYFLKESVQLFGVDSFYDLPHFTRTRYHRLQTSVWEGMGFFEFLVPMIPETWLNAERVAHYRQLLDAGECPTGFCLTILDVRSPATFQTSETTSLACHACLLHVLLDGHHKVEAAHQTGKPISFISFLARDYCAVRNDHDIERALRQLV